MNKTIKLIFFLFVALLINRSNSIYAESYQTGITVTPANRSVIVNPGMIVEGSFFLMNHESKDINYAIDIKYLDSNSNIEDLPDTLLNSLEVLNGTTFVIKEKDKREIKYRFIPSKELEDGTYNMLILVKTLSDGQSESASVQQLISYHLSIDYSNNGEINPQIKIKNLRSTNQIHMSSNQEISFDIENVSNFTAKPIVYFQLIDSQSNIIYKEVLNEGFEVVGANSTKQFSVGIDKVLPIGPIDVQVLAIESKTGQQDIANITFFSFYWQYALICVSIIFMILVLVRIYQRLNSHKKIYKIDIPTKKTRIGTIRKRKS